MQFKPGQCGNPKGRPKGSGHGRSVALAELDAMLSDKKNRKLLAAALQKQFEANPFTFFKTIIMPLMPKEAKIAMSPDGIVEWKSLIDAFPVSKAPLQLPASPPEPKQS